MSASAPFADIKKMLNKCAPGYEIRLATHSRVVTFGGKVFRELPKSDTVEHGHIRKMVRFLEIPRKCAAKWLPGVIKAEEEQAEQPSALAASSGSQSPNSRDKSSTKA